MADEDLSSIVAVQGEQITQLTLQVSALDVRVTTNETDISTLQNPPVGVPPEMLSWFSAGHTITEVDTILDTTITDINTAHDEMAVTVAQLQTDLDTETANRTSADDAFQSALDDLQDQIDNTNTALLAETNARAELATSTSSAFITVNNRIDSTNADLSTEVTARTTDTTSLFNSVDALNASMSVMQQKVIYLEGTGVDPVGALASQMITTTQIANDTAQGLDDEETARISADQALENSIEAITSQVSNNSAQIIQEAQIRADADNALDTRLHAGETQLSANTADIATETSARQSADSVMQSTIDGHTDQILANTSAISAETSARTSADSTMQTQINSNTSGVQGNTADIITLENSMSAVQAGFGLTIDGFGYITGYRDLGNAQPISKFLVSNINHDIKFQNRFYEGKFFLPAANDTFNLPVTWDSNYGTAASTNFHGTDGNDYTRNVLVYGGSIFYGTAYGSGGMANRLAKDVSTFVIRFSGAVNRYLSLWYRIKTAPGDTTQRWYPVDVADNLIPNQRSYEQTSKATKVTITVPYGQVIEFGLTVLNTVDATIASLAAGLDNIYGGSASITAINLTTIA